MYLKFLLKETLSVLKSSVLSIFYLAVEKGGGGYQRKCDSPLQWGVGGGG